MWMFYKVMYVELLVLAQKINIEKKKEENTEKEELTLQNVPKAVNYLINEIAEMRV